MKRVGLVLAGLALPLAAAAETLQIGSSTPASTLRSLPDLVNNIYNLAYLIGGLLAFGAVVYGAVRYTFSGGNPSAQSDARDQLTQAAFGLLLLLGSYVVLNTISPNLTSFTFPSLKKVAPPEAVRDITANPICALRCGSGMECRYVSSAAKCVPIPCNLPCIGNNICQIVNNKPACLDRDTPPPSTQDKVGAFKACRALCAGNTLCQNQNRCADRDCPLSCTTGTCRVLIDTPICAPGQ